MSHDRYGTVRRPLTGPAPWPPSSPARRGPS
jgi:hypothetical protein